ncbi:hypothetical protein SmaMPs15_000248 [Stenotrophomonas maltophilia phage vB_SmaM_Ps15]|uniref:Uncharacterized protein n=1 Tax=Stenotrophomonas maltophilia phage vB_SmaM_Ps15 TaxID=3071007 RepID=A0AAE9FMH0_9CAUD|nr:hypothetical protein PQC01_gp230 [Stenotrophomonas maltophilia phage vB_SmaM_Ps15]UMO77399.1 hypothetical protein SmaMPs15_000248 [Stenotrophomonas maltophilia phage vB_SmaM_Ps15]
MSIYTLLDGSVEGANELAEAWKRCIARDADLQIGLVNARREQHKRLKKIADLKTSLYQLYAFDSEITAHARFVLKQELFLLNAERVEGESFIRRCKDRIKRVAAEQIKVTEQMFSLARTTLASTNLREDQMVRYMKRAGVDLYRGWYHKITTQSLMNHLNATYIP